MVIAAIIAAIAFPAYRRQVMESRRTAAKTALLDLTSREEKYYSTNNAYASVTNLGYATISGNAVQVPSSNDDYYNVTVTLGNPPSSYTATATPQGNQANDACGSFQITNLGAQSVTGTAANCW